MKNPFDVVDRIFLINLPGRTNNLMDALYECEKNGIKNRVEVIEGAKKGNTGMIEATIRALEGTEEESVMIIQDDMRFINNPLKTFQNAYEQIRWERWRLLYLDGKKQNKYRYPGWCLLRREYTSTTIIYNKKIVSEVLQILRANKNFPGTVGMLLATHIQPYHTCLVIDPPICTRRSINVN